MTIRTPNNQPYMADTKPNAKKRRVNINIPVDVKDMLTILCDILYDLYDKNLTESEKIRLIIKEALEFLDKYPCYPRLGIDTICGTLNTEERKKKGFTKPSILKVAVRLTEDEISSLHDLGTPGNPAGRTRYAISMGFLKCFEVVISKIFLFDKEKAKADKSKKKDLSSDYYLRACNKPLVSSVGAKNSVRNCIRTLIPDDVWCIIELFARTAAITVHSGRNFPKGIVNELQEGWYTLLYILKNFPVMLYLKLKSDYYTVNSDRHYNIQKEKSVSGYDSTLESMVERAADLIYLCYTSYSGADGNSFDNSATDSGFQKAIGMIFFYSYKLKNVRITNHDIEDALAVLSNKIKSLNASSKEKKSPTASSKKKSHLYSLTRLTF